MTEHLRMSASCFTSEFWKTFQSTFSIEHLWTNCLFQVQVSGYQLANTLTVSQLLFKHIVKEQEIAIGRYSFNKNSWKLSVKNLIRSEAAGCKLTSIWKKNSFTHTLLRVIPSFSQIASWLLLPKRLWTCASNLSFRKYKQKVVLLVFSLFHYNSSIHSYKSTFFI